MPLTLLAESDDEDEEDVEAESDDDSAHFIADSTLICFLMLYGCSTLIILFSVAVHRATSRSSKKSLAKWSNNAEGRWEKGEGEPGWESECCIG